MSYSCCYVLTDNKDLKYFNQMMISLSSLRYTGFKGSVYVVTDNETALLINPRHSELSDLSVEIIVVEVENRFTEKEKSRYLKTSLRKYIRGDTLFLDTDTIFVSCPPEWISDDDIAMAYDLNGLKDYNSWHKKVFDQCGFVYQKGQIIFNSGVIWMRDTEYVHSVFEKWHSFWKELLIRYKMPNDQASLNYLCKNGEITIERLDDRFNAQIRQSYFSPFTLAKAVLFHYNNVFVADPIFPLNDPSIQKIDYRDDRMQKIIRDPLAVLPNCRWIKKGSVTDECLDTQSFKLGLAIFRKHRRLFSLFEGFSKLLLKTRGLIPKKKHNGSR